MTHEQAAHLQNLEPSGSTPTLLTRLHVLMRRKWVVLGPLVIAPAVAFVITAHEKPLYQASAQVLLSHDSLATSVSSLVESNDGLDPVRLGQTQADLARVPAIAQRTLAAAGVQNRTALDFLKTSHVSTTTNADLLTFDVTDPDPALASRLATEYARQFVTFGRGLESAVFDRALKSIGRRLDHLRAAGEFGSPLYLDLTAKRQQLLTIEQLQTPTALLVQPADSASNIRPRPVREALLGGVLGLVIGVALAFWLDAIDTRARTSEEIEERLRLPLLGRLPSPPRDTQNASTTAILSNPADPYAESIRALLISLGLGRAKPGIRAIMVTSATEREGKSTTAANLAVASAQAGRRVVLCDLDARRPAIDRFGVRAGLVDVALEEVELEDALSVAALPTMPLCASQAGDGNNDSGDPGTLEVLTIGRRPPDPVELVGSAGVARIVEKLRARADIVLIDAPPLLDGGDVLTLSSHVDGLLIVTRLGIITRSVLSDMRRILAACPAPALGFVLSGVSVGDVYRRYGYRPQPTRSGLRPASALMQQRGQIIA